MAAIFECPSCRRRLSIPRGATARTSGQCPVCGFVQELFTEIASGETRFNQVPCRGPDPPPRSVEAEGKTQLNSTYSPLHIATSTKARQRRWPILASLCVFCIGIAMAVVEWRRWRAPAGLEAETRYLPDNLILLRSNRPREIVGTSFCRACGDVVPGGLSTDSFPREAVHRLTIASGPGGEVKILTMGCAMNPDVIKGRSDQWKEEMVGKVRLYTLDGKAFCLPEERLVLFGPPDTLRRILHRNAAPGLSDNMQRALRRMDFSKHSAGVVNVSVRGRDFGFGLARLIRRAGIETAIYEIGLDSDMAVTLTYLFSAKDHALAMSNQLRVTWPEMDPQGNALRFVKEHEVTAVGDSAMLHYVLTTDFLEQSRGLLGDLPGGFECFPLREGPPPPN